MPFDPFGDFACRGYLRNFAGEQDPERIKRLEHRSFSANVLAALEALQRVQGVSYQDVLDVHRTLFGSVYPWAGQDRLALAPNIAVGKAGHFDLFAHPRDIKRAVEYGLDLAHNPVAMRDRPGEVFGLLAYGHPVLEGNGRMLMTVHADLSRRAGFHVAWQNVSKADFLSALTEELRHPGGPLDRLLAAHVVAGPLPLAATAARFSASADLNAPGQLPPPPQPRPRSGPEM